MASFFDNKARAAAAKSAATNGASSSKAAAATKEQNERLQPWVEKYRPKTLADVTSQDHTTQLLQRTLRTPNLPHLLFYGPPGTGKTSTILALAKQLFGPELFRTRVLELNASDERGISIVRSKIKDFARQQLSSPPAGPAGEEYRRRHPCPPFKMIVLDEADSMTQDAQAALRRTMESYSRITRFCLVCNYVTRIIDPLASRCSKFRFKSLAGGDARRRVEEIAAAEGVALGDGAAEEVVLCADGDLRRAITFLQSAARLVGAVGSTSGGGRGKKDGGAAAADDDDDADAMDVDDTAAGGEVSVSTVREIAGVIPATTVSTLADAVLRPDAKSAGQTYSRVSRLVTQLVADGWSATQLLSQLYSSVLFDEKVADAAKNRVLGVFSEADKRLVDGADEELTVLDLCLRVAGCVS